MPDVFSAYPAVLTRAGGKLVVVYRSAHCNMFLNVSHLPLINVDGKDNEAFMGRDTTVGVHYENPASFQKFKLAIQSGKPSLNCSFRTTLQYNSRSKVENLIGPVCPVEG